jgi:outer membrane cobalamin receptor
MAKRRVAFTVVLMAGLLSFAPRTAAAQKRSRDVITREEIEASAQKDQDIFAVIRSLRPHFLAPARGVRTLGNSSVKMSVYVDGVRETDANSLKSLPALAVEEVRYLDPSRSESEYGPDANGGAVVVKRRKDLPGTTQVVRDTTKPPQR